MRQRSEYSQKLLDPRWQKKRLEILTRDDWRCQVCGDETKTLHVHHAWYSAGEPWDAPNNSLYTCCVDCHEPEHELQREWTRVLLQTLASIGVRSSTDFESFAIFYGAGSKADLSTRAEALGKAIRRFEEFKSKCGDSWFENHDVNL